MDANQVEDVAVLARMLPLRAARVLGLVVFRIGENEDTWWSQKELADDLGVCDRTVRRWLVYLVNCGLIQMQKTQSTNRYRATPLGLSVSRRLGQKTVLSDRTKMSSRTGQKCPLRNLLH
jgi:predicted ArsR family transcriptional regulator